MPSLLNVNIQQSSDGLYSATIAEFPQISASGASSLDELRYALEKAISMVPLDDGTPRGAVTLPPLVPGETTWPGETV